MRGGRNLPFPLTHTRTPARPLPEPAPLPSPAAGRGPSEAARPLLPRGGSPAALPSFLRRRPRYLLVVSAVARRTGAPSFSPALPGEGVPAAAGTARLLALREVAASVPQPVRSAPAGGLARRRPPEHAGSRAGQRGRGSEPPSASCSEPSAPPPPAPPARNFTALGSAQAHPGRPPGFRAAILRAAEGRGAALGRHVEKVPACLP